MTIRLRAALKFFIDDREHDGLSPRTINALKTGVERLFKATGDPWTHEVTYQQVEG